MHVHINKCIKISMITSAPLETKLMSFAESALGLTAVNALPNPLPCSFSERMSACIADSVAEIAFVSSLLLAWFDFIDVSNSGICEPNIILISMHTASVVFVTCILKSLHTHTHTVPD